MLQYWSFVCEEFIKLRQIRVACKDIDSELVTVSLESEKLPTDSLIGIEEYDDDNDSLTIGTRKHKSYFNYSLKNHLKSGYNEAHINENLLIQTGLLELILDSINQLNIELNDDTFELNCNELTSCLDNALKKFDLIETNLTDTHLNSYQLENCKRIGEALVKLRDKYESLLDVSKSSRQCDMFKQEKYEELLNKLKCLIEYLKNKFNKNFSNHKIQSLNKLQNSTISEDRRISSEDGKMMINRFEFIARNTDLDFVNLSLSEWLKQNDPLSCYDDFTTTTVTAATEASLSKVTKEIESFEKIDLKTPSRPNDMKLIQETDTEELSEKADKKIVLEDEDDHVKVSVLENRESQQKASPSTAQSFKTTPFELIENKVSSTELVNVVRKEENTKRQEELKELKEDELKSSKKISDLISTLKNERVEQRFKFNRDILKEQFLTVNFQFKQLNHEIKSLDNCSMNRLKLLGEFRDIVDSMNLNYTNMDAFQKQFNIFFWLFQNQPSFIDEFFRNQENFDFQNIGNKSGQPRAH